MAIRKRPDSLPEEMLEANRRQLEQLATACGEEAGLHRPLADVVGGAITGIPEDTDLAQALSDRQTTDLLVQLLDENREQVERALERVREGAYGICEARMPVALGPPERQNRVGMSRLPTCGGSARSRLPTCGEVGARSAPGGDAR